MSEFLKRAGEVAKQHELEGANEMLEQIANGDLLMMLYCFEGEDGELSMRLIPDPKQTEIPDGDGNKINSAFKKWWNITEPKVESVVASMSTLDLWEREEHANFMAGMVIGRNMSSDTLVGGKETGTLALGHLYKEAQVLLQVEKTRVSEPKITSNFKD
jgi:hypothetical protein